MSGPSLHGAKVEIPPKTVMLEGMRGVRLGQKTKVLAALLLAAAGIAAAAAVPAAVRAASCKPSDFVCPNPDPAVPNSDFLRYDGAVEIIEARNLNNNGGPNHQDPTNENASDPSPPPGNVTAGDVIRLKLRYRPNRDGRNVYAWINGDLLNNNSYPYPGQADPPGDRENCGQNGGFSNISGIPGDVQRNDVCPSDGYFDPIGISPYDSSTYPAQKANNCPSFYTWNGYTNYPGPVPSNSGRRYNTGDPNTLTPAIPYVNTCAYSGVSVVWRNAGSQKDKTYTYSADFKVNPKTANPGKMCFKAYLSEDGLTGPSVPPVATTGAQDYIAKLKSRSNRKMCIKLGEITVRGHVGSTWIDTSSTGRPFANTSADPISTTRSPVSYQLGKDSGNWQYVSTGASGNYNFKAYAGTPIFIKGDNPYVFNGAGNNNFKGTGNTYRVVGAAPFTYTNITCDTDCGGYDFTYDPQPTHPITTKAVSGVSNNTCTAVPNCVSPGSRIDYTIVAKNITDANLRDVIIDDPKPLNMVPGSVLIDSVQFDTYTGNDVPGRPYGWAVSSTSGLCFGTNNPFVYGYPISGQLINSAFQCGYGNSPNNQPNVYVHFNVMPAYSVVTIKLHGTVKAAPDIGVYPMWTTYATCADNGYFPGGGTLSGGRIKQCEDKTNGFQGVSNWAAGVTRGSWILPINYNNWPAPGGLPAFTAIQYNPIPGRLACAPGKYADGDHADPTGPGSVSICNSTSGSTVTKDQNYLYVPERSDQNKYTVNLQLFRDTSLGPIDFSVYDQSLGGGLNPPIYTSQPEMSGGTSQAYNAGARQPVWTGFADGTGNDAQYLSFLAHFDGAGGPGVGGSVPNKGQVCITETWSIGHPLSCLDTNTINFKRYRIDNPVVNTTGGDVHAGAGGGSALCAKKGNANPTTTVYNNTVTVGDYFVTSTGDQGSRSRNVSSPGGTVGVIYKPNMCQSAENYPVGQTINAGDAVLAGNIESAKGISDGRLLKETPPSPGALTLGDGSQINISQRWTLYVRGDLYIKSNIRYAAPARSGSVSREETHPSFGVIVDGNIYIDPSVSRIDGFYVASGLTNTCATYAGGSVTTLAQNAGPGLSVAQCKANTLTVGGSMYANTFRFNRTAVGSSAEQVDFSNRLFTATPPAFNSLKVATQLSQYLIEPLPRY